MRLETHLFLKEILLADHSALELLKADFTFANRRLARHYGLPDADELGDAFQRVNVRGPRGGLLMQGGWLTLTSHPDTTSPTKRGKWILSELLCQTPPPPPPGADRLPGAAQGATRRERLAEHASVEPCRSCHLLFDPLGLALENFDPIGRWRDEDEGAAHRRRRACCRGPTSPSRGRPSWPQALQKDPALRPLPRAQAADLRAGTGHGADRRAGHRSPGRPASSAAATASGTWCRPSPPAR